MTVGSDEQELVDGLHGDEPAALAALFDRYGDRIYNHCFRHLGDWAEAEDATSSVFLEVWRHRGRVRLHDGSAAPWLYGVATNVCRNAGRSRRRYLRAVTSLPAPAAEPDHSAHTDPLPHGASRVARRTGLERALDHREHPGLRRARDDQLLTRARAHPGRERGHVGERVRRQVAQARRA